MSLMFTPTSRIKRAVGLINDLNAARFPLLLSRIIQKLHTKDERTFTEEEEEKLQTALNLEQSDLELVLQSCEFFLQQAAYHTAKPGIFTDQLRQLKLEEDKVSVLVETWTENAKSIVEEYRKRSYAPKQLESIDWRLHVQIGQSSQSKQKIPVALMELGLMNDASGEKEKVKMEFTHDELYAFYNKLERIQSQIDYLS